MDDVDSHVDGNCDEDEDGDENEEECDDFDDTQIDHEAMYEVDRESELEEQKKWDAIEDFHQAVASGDLPLMQSLVAAGADING